jgi:hypothetical protein
MRRLLTITAFALLVTGLGVFPEVNPAAAPAGERSRGLEDKPTRRALLVGVTKYPNLPDHQLAGPQNDVRLMKTMLVKDFAVPEANIVTLTEGDGAENPKLLPTRANIRREFERLAEVTRPGDEVVILLGGHGSQQPENPKAKDPEIDGLDEIFLPRDVGKWNNGVGSVDNAIIDDELGEWVSAISEKKQAFVWLVIDACHSGTMIRDVKNGETARRAEPGDLGIPPKAIAAAQKAAAQRQAAAGKARGEVAKPTSLGLSGEKNKGVFAIYAAQPTETTPECPMPAGEEKAPTHGVLTYTICQTLSQARAANSPISYRELGHRIHQQYAANGRTSPTPMVEYPGANPDREVLGPGIWKDRANILISDVGGAYTVNAGQLVGLTTGSVLQVLPPAGMGDEPLGHAKVTGTRVIDADVTPCAFEKVPAPKALPHGARCKVVYIDYGDVQLRVAVAASYPSADKEPKPIPAEVRNPLVAKLKELSKPDSLFRFVDDPKDAAWLLAPLPDGQVRLIPAAGLKPEDDPTRSKGYVPRRGFGPVPVDGMERWLTEMCGRIARFEGLLTVAGSRTNDLLSPGELAPRMKVEPFLFHDDTKPLTPLTWPATDLTVYAKDRVRLKVTNTGKLPMDLTVLYLDTNYKIGGIWPTEPGGPNRIRAGESFPVPINIFAPPAGTEHVVLIAVKGTGPNVDLLCLKQEGLPRALEEPPAATKGLSRLLARQVYKKAEGAESARGGGLDVVDDYAMALVTWKVKAEKRPETETPKK